MESAGCWTLFHIVTKVFSYSDLQVIYYVVITIYLLQSKNKIYIYPHIKVPTWCILSFSNQHQQTNHAQIIFCKQKLQNDILIW